jgi:hypothetical protein
MLANLPEDTRRLIGRVALRCVGPPGFLRFFVLLQPGPSTPAEDVPALRASKRQMLEQLQMVLGLKPSIAAGHSGKMRSRTRRTILLALS